MVAEKERVWISQQDWQLVSGWQNEPADRTRSDGKVTYVARVFAGAGVSDSASEDSVSDSEKFLKKRPLMLCFRRSIANHANSLWLLRLRTGQTAREQITLLVFVYLNRVDLIGSNRIEPEENVAFKYARKQHRTLSTKHTWSTQAPLHVGGGF